MPIPINKHLLRQFECIASIRVHKHLSFIVSIRFGCLGFMAYHLCRVFNAKFIFIQVISSISNNSV